MRTTTCNLLIELSNFALLNIVVQNLEIIIFRSPKFSWNTSKHCVIFGHFSRIFCCVENPPPVELCFIWPTVRESLGRVWVSAAARRGLSLVSWTPSLASDWSVRIHTLGPTWQKEARPSCCRLAHKRFLLNLRSQLQPGAVDVKN